MNVGRSWRNFVALLLWSVCNRSWRLFVGGSGLNIGWCLLLVCRSVSDRGRSRGDFVALLLLWGVRGLCNFITLLGSWGGIRCWRLFISWSLRLRQRYVSWFGSINGSWNWYIRGFIGRLLRLVDSGLRSVGCRLLMVICRLLGVGRLSIGRS
jgi:hypothetical protein